MGGFWEGRPGVLRGKVARGRVWWVVSWGFARESRPWAGLGVVKVARGRVLGGATWGFARESRPWAGLGVVKVARGRVWVW
ncbi:hypothetical protein KEM60_01515 [Austwickia sp. TVS 96-490-7B]|nr:hypothetical protein [Austwickia sp. TVS 96-490-7B]